MMHRRAFLESSAAAGIASAFASVSATTARAANDKIAICMMGVRGRGGGVLSTFASLPDVEVRYVCDIDDAPLALGIARVEQKTGQRPQAIKDFRKAIDDKSVDAIVMGTPDHWHALPTIHGCMNGKDVYVEKPDGHNIVEGKTMVAAARKYGRMVQLGTQARSAPDLKEAAKYVAAGNLGKVIFGRAWETDRQGAIPKVADSDPPKGVDYDLWLGAAPKRPFNQYRFHGNWRWFFDYGCGDLGNDGVHRLDFCRWHEALRTAAMPTPFEADPHYQPSADEPFVFHLLGQAAFPQSLALTETDHLDLLVATARHPGITPPSVHRALRGGPLLFIGQPLTDWSFRALARSLGVATAA